MKLSRRAKRMNRHYARMHKSGGLNLVSLMDIFTILVFFLMVNSSDVKILSNDSAVKLPKSQAEEMPKQTLLITVTQDSVIVQGRKVASVSDIVRSGGDSIVISGLKQELEYQASRASQIAPQKIAPQKQVAQAGLPVTIMADKDLHYRVLKRVMATCADARYTQISLAVSKISPAKSLQPDGQGSM